MQPYLPPNLYATGDASLPVFRLDEVGECLRLLVAVVVVTVAVAIILGSDIFHLVNTATFGASFHRSLTGHAEPCNNVRVGWVASAASVLLITSRLDHDGVVDGSFSRSIERSHIEDIYTVHLAENFQSLQTSRLLEIGRDGSGGGTGSEQVFLGLNFAKGLHLLADTSMGLDVFRIAADGGDGKASFDSWRNSGATSHGDGGSLQKHGGVNWEDRWREDVVVDIGDVFSIAKV